MADLPNRIRELRTAPRPGFPTGWSLRMVGEKAGISTTMVSDLEMGRREFTYYYMRRLADVFEVPIEQLLLPQDASNALSADELRLLAVYRRGEAGQQAQALAMLEVLIPEPANGRRVA